MTKFRNIFFFCTGFSFNLLDDDLALGSAMAKSNAIRGDHAATHALHRAHEIFANRKYQRCNVTIVHLHVCPSRYSISKYKKEKHTLSTIAK